MIEAAVLLFAVCALAWVLDHVFVHRVPGQLADRDYSPSRWRCVGYQFEGDLIYLRRRWRRRRWRRSRKWVWP